MQQKSGIMQQLSKVNIPGWLAGMFMSCTLCVLFSAAPSGPPTSVSGTSTSTTITVQWGAVDCIHRNGDITGYSVRYREMGSGSTQTVNVSGYSYTISNLTSSTTYSIQVTAENSVGSGVYSDHLIVHTKSKYIVYLLLSPLILVQLHSMPCVFF